MKALEKLSFPKLESEYLENILRQLVNQYNIIQMFFNRNASCSHLIIHIDKNSDAKILQLNNWVKKVKKNWNIDVYFIYSSRLHHLYFLASPFIEYCKSSAKRRTDVIIFDFKFCASLSVIISILQIFDNRLRKLWTQLETTQKKCFLIREEFFI